MREFIVSVVYRNLDLDDVAAMDALAATGLVTAAETREDGTAIVTGAVTHSCATRAATELIEAVANHLPAAHPVMAHRDLVNTTDIAERIGVTREGVRNWVAGKRRGGAFPTHVASPGGQRVWNWGAVNAWLTLNLELGDGLSYPTLAEFGAIDSYIEVRSVGVHAQIAGVGHWTIASAIPAKAVLKPATTTIQIAEGPWQMAS